MKILRNENSKNEKNKNNKQKNTKYIHFLLPLPLKYSVVVFLLPPPFANLKIQQLQANDDVIFIDYSCVI